MTKRERDELIFKIMAAAIGGAIIGALSVIVDQQVRAYLNRRNATKTLPKSSAS